MAKTIIDLSGVGGLAPKFAGDYPRSQSDPNLRYIGGENQVAEGIYNPFARYGYLSPSTTGATSLSFSTGSHTDKFVASIYDELNNDHYWANEGTDVFKCDGLEDVSLTRMFQVSGATLTDLEIYQVNGVRKIFYSYKHASGSNIGMADLPITTNDDDWLSAACSGGAVMGTASEIFMVKADNGFMYVLDSNAVHKIDGTSATGGTNGTATMNTLLFPPDFQLTEAVDYRGNLYITVLGRTTRLVPGTLSADQFSGVNGIYIWDRFTSTINMRDFIPLQGVREIRKIYVGPDGDLRLITTASNGQTQIRQFTGSAFKVIAELGQHSFPHCKDSLTVANSATYWLGDDRKFYAHGKVDPSQDMDALYCLFNVDSSTSSTVEFYGGAILYGGSNGLTPASGYRTNMEGFYLNWEMNNNTRQIKRWLHNGAGTIDGAIQSQAQGDVYSLVKFLPRLSTVNDIYIYCFPINSTGSSTAGTVKIYFNQSTTAFKSFTVTRDMASRGYVHIPIGKNYVNSIQIEIEFNTATSVGQTDFAPAFAEVDYTPSDTHVGK